MEEHPDKRDRRHKETEDRLTRQYREVGIKAVAAAVECTNSYTKKPTPVKKLDSRKPDRESDDE
jgi:hypothetical protein